MALGDGLVELVAEGDRRTVGYLELHGDDCGNATPHQGLGHTGKRILCGVTRPLAGIEDHQAERVEILKEHRQRRGGDHTARPRVVLEGQHTFLAVESAVPDEVEDVDIVVTQCIAQAGQTVHRRESGHVSDPLRSAWPALVATFPVPVPRRAPRCRSGSTPPPIRSEGL